MLYVHWVLMHEGWCLENWYADWLLTNVCQDSLKALREKQQRTVYRLTLVKGWNTEEIDAYFNLFSIGKPDFVEIKGVTYCGS